MLLFIVAILPIMAQKRKFLISLIGGTEKEVLDFLNWFIMLPYKHKIFVTGNHDTCLWNAEAIENLPKNVHFLQDSECKIEGITFFGLAYNHSEQVYDSR